MLLFNVVELKGTLFSHTKVNWGESMKILIIEDDADIRRLLKTYLKREGFEVDEAASGDRGLQMQANQNYDLIVLDIMIPEIDGWTVCQKIRKTSHVPIIMVTAKSAESDKILGLELGADDYLVKPFSPKELIARIKALFRRIKNHEISPASLRSEPLEFGYLMIDPEKHTATFKGLNLGMSPKEFSILYFLAKNKDKVFTRNELLLEIWGDQFTDVRTVDAHIKTIREKFRKSAVSAAIIETVWGVGYKFGEATEDV